MYTWGCLSGDVYLSLYINPTLQLLVGVLIYNEVFTKMNAITFAFVWAAVILFVLDSLRKHKVKA